MSDFAWFNNSKAFDEYCKKLSNEQLVIEEYVETKKYFFGYCVFCSAVRKFKVSGGAMLGDRIHLREGMICEKCGSLSRHRLLFSALQKEFGPVFDRSKKYFILERVTDLFDNLKEKIPSLEGSEYLGRDYLPGQIADSGGKPIRNEDFLSLSLKDNSIDCLLHADVLEHVPDCDKAMSEAYRVLAPNGIMLFTVPFFNLLHKTLVRAYVNSSGDIINIEEPAFHGDPLSPKGCLVFYHFGWDMLEKLQKAGFSQAMLGMNFDPFQGFLSTGEGESHLQPILFLCRK